MDHITFAGLIRIAFPGRTVCICDGGYIDFNGERYFSDDEVFGVIAGFEITGTGADEAPGGKITFLTPSPNAAAELTSPGFQKSLLQIWMAEVDPASASVVGTPKQLVHAQLDRPIVKEGRGYTRVEIEFVGKGERLMMLNEGNWLNGTFHKRLFPGEYGFDNAIGMNVTKAWGVATPPRGVSTYSSGGGGGTGFGRLANVVNV